MAAAAAVLALVVLPGVRGTDTATAADMLASMNAAQSGGTRVVRLHSVDGFVASQHTSPEPGAIDAQAPRLKHETTADLVLSVEGSYRVSEVLGLPGTARVSSDYGYDQDRHEMRAASARSSDGVLVLHPARNTDFQTVGVSYLTYQAAANSVGALLTEADPKMPVSETSYLGRPAWQATLLDPTMDRSQIVVVDKATGLLLASDSVRHGTKGDELILLPAHHADRRRPKPTRRLAGGAAPEEDDTPAALELLPGRRRAVRQSGVGRCPRLADAAADPCSGCRPATNARK